MQKYEMLVGLQIKTDDVYAQYCKAMKPLLIEHGGGFRYDFKVSETLISESKNNINRVFAIYFENKEKMNSFF